MTSLYCDIDIVQRLLMFLAEAADVFICSGNECTPIHTDCFHVM